MWLRREGAVGCRDGRQRNGVIREREICLRVEGVPPANPGLDTLPILTVDRAKSNLHPRSSPRPRIDPPKNYPAARTDRPTRGEVGTWRDSRDVDCHIPPRVRDPTHTHKRKPRCLLPQPTDERVPPPASPSGAPPAIDRVRDETVPPRVSCATTEWRREKEEKKEGSKSWPREARPAQ